MWEDEQFFKALKTVGPNFEKIAEMIGTRNKSQVRTFHNAEVKKINAVLAPLGVQVDPLDQEEVHTAMESWHSMKDRLGPHAHVTAKGVLSGKRDTERNRLAWEFKNELDKSVWTEGKRRAKLRALGVLGAEETGKAGVGGVLGVVVGDGGAVKHAGRGRPKGSKNRPAGSPGRGGVGRVGAKGAGGRPRAEADTSKATRVVSTAKASRDDAKLSGAKKSKANDASRRNARGARDGEAVGADDPTRARLMLQLFAVDDVTKSALLAAGINPHLELTFRAKKSVPGLMQHLAVKWAGAVARLPKPLRDAEPTLQLYPFESASAAEAKGAWNASHDGATATDIFDACGRPAMFRVRYGWVPGAEAAAGRTSRRRRPRCTRTRCSAAAVARAAAAACPREPLAAQARRRGDARRARLVLPRARERLERRVPLFGRDVRRRVRRRSRRIRVRVRPIHRPRLHLRRRPRRRGALRRAAGDARDGRRRSRRFGSGIRERARGRARRRRRDRPRGAPAGVALPSSGDFTLSGFADPREFSNMCREMGLEDPSAGPGRHADPRAGSHPAGRPVEPSLPGGTPSKPEPRAHASEFASAAPGELAERARREVLAEFAPACVGEASVTVGGILENDMFSLTRMLGDVPAENGATRDGANLEPSAGGDGGPTSFAGMFSGNLADAMGAKPAR